jgi:II/X family phage/plasmid replication protein
VIDWLTLILDVPEHLQERCSRHAAQSWQICKVCPATGEVEWTTACHESVRSDTHQVQIQVTSARIKISGSPARSMGLENNVFGSDNLRQCARAHVRAAQIQLPDIPLPKPNAWKITRCDVTRNYDFGSAAEVRQALGYLRQFDGGRYKVNTKRGETVYWSPGSNLRSAKAYHKGPHLEMQVKKGQASATDRQIDWAQRLLRLEEQLSSQWWRRRRALGENQWSVDVFEEFENYFGGLIGKVEVVEMGELEAIRKVERKNKDGEMALITENQALAAYRTWQVIRMVGHREAEASMPKSTWYRHKSILNDSGLQWGDFAVGQVVPFRRRCLVLDEPVTSWEELARVAG